MRNPSSKYHASPGKGGQQVGEKIQRERVKSDEIVIECLCSPASRSKGR